MADPAVAALLARIEALEAEKAAPSLPPIDPGWGKRTCQECGKVAVVIDADDAKRRDGTIPRNGEGWCRKHVPADVKAAGYARLEMPKS